MATLKFEANAAPAPIYRVVALDESGWTVTDTDDIMALAADLGWLHTGQRADNPGRIKIRPQLVGQPEFRESSGPAWGGEENGRPVIRYETWAAYDRLST